MQLLAVRNLRKVYTTRFSSNKTVALNGINFDVSEGDFVAIMGESGSGKTTLLNIIAALDRPTDGDVFLKGQSLREIKDRDITTFRRNNLGFVFQDFNLLANFNNKDNILLPLVLANFKYEDMEKRLDVAKALGIEGLLDKYPYEVSGGQRQRVAVARALINRPKLILADEPTGALDSRSSDELLNIFERINDEGQTILMVTHSVKAAAFAKRVLFIKDGTIFHELYKGDQSYENFFIKISDTLTLLLKGSDVQWNYRGA